MAVGTRGLKDGMGTSYLRVGDLEADASSISTLELADDSVTRDKEAQLTVGGSFTLGGGGANVYVGFSGDGVAVTLGSPAAIIITPFASMIDDVPFVVDYSPSGFNASGNSATTCFYIAKEVNV